MEQLGHVIANFQAQLTTKINIGDTTATIDKNTDADGEEIPNGKYFLTVDVDSSRKEHYACTLTRTADGSNLTNLKTLNRTTGAETSGSLRLHRIGAKVVITDFATILKLALKMSGQEGVDPASPMFYTSVPTLSSPEQFATVQYVLDVATGGSLSFDKQTISAQVAGENGILVNDLVYFKEADARWYKVDATDTTKFQGVRIGFSQTVADISDPMQIAISGPINAFSGLTPGAKYYASDTPGLVSATPGTNSVFIGWALNATIILIEMPEKLAMQGGGDFGVPSAINKFVTQKYVPMVAKITKISPTLIGSSSTRFDITNIGSGVYRYTWDGTGTDPIISALSFPIGSMVDIRTQNFNINNNGSFLITGSNTNYFEINNVSGVSENDKTIGSGFINKSTFFIKDLNSKRITVEVQAGGGDGGSASGSRSGGSGGGGGGYSKKEYVNSDLLLQEPVISGSNRGSSIFKTIVCSPGGNGATGNGATGGGGGGATGGDLNIQGGDGGSAFGYYDGGSGAVGAGFGGNSFFAGITTSPSNNSDNGGFNGKLFGGGGSGGKNYAGSGNTSGGKGGDGLVIVTEFY